ncbi:MAG TPA: hypothetical protein VFM37_15715 [Pseudonocardiaceae bacterium]|nr:hypothetical protein [Pseudonocardiaceae bacterium]
MTTKRSPHWEQPADSAAVHADDLLLGAIGRGAPTPASEPVVDLLSAWRAEITQAADRSLARDSPIPIPRGAAHPTQRSPRPLLLTSAAVAVIALLCLATLNATPQSPLWPITTAVFPQRADARLAQEAIHHARQAAAEGRYADSQRHLDRATDLLDRLGSDPRIEQLRSEIDAIRTAILDADPPASSAEPPVPAPSEPPVPAPSEPPVPAPSEPPVPAPSGTARPSPARPANPAPPTAPPSSIAPLSPVAPAQPEAPAPATSVPAESPAPTNPASPGKPAHAIPARIVLPPPGQHRPARPYPAPRGSARVPDSTPRTGTHRDPRDGTPPRQCRNCPLSPHHSKVAVPVYR